MVSLKEHLPLFQIFGQCSKGLKSFSYPTSCLLNARIFMISMHKDILYNNACCYGNKSTNMAKNKLCQVDEYIVNCISSLYTHITLEFDVFSIAGVD